MKLPGQVLCEAFGIPQELLHNGCNMGLTKFVITVSYGQLVTIETEYVGIDNDMDIAPLFKTFELKECVDAVNTGT